MPVVRINIPRFCKMVGAERRKVMERLPYVGLDIEGVEGDWVRVEYSPNRPDFGTDYGIARALRGLMAKEVGLPSFPISSSGVSMAVDKRLGRIRPFIACAVVRGLRLDDEDIRQLISLQEDLHNGLGRKRKKVAIGLHDLDSVRPPFSYQAVESSFKFIPLGSRRQVAISSILSDTDEGRTYGSIFGKTRLYPVITDVKGSVLSFPPVINGEATRVTSKTRNMFIDVTSTEMKAGDDVLAVMATTLAEAGGKLGRVSIRYPGKPRITPDLEPVKLSLDVELTRSVLGMNMTRKEINRSLAKSRIGVVGDKALGPRYRVDLLHPVDLAEEVALGYGVDRIHPLYPPSKQPGTFDRFEKFLDSASTLMAGSGMIEMMTYELVDAKSLYLNFQRSSDQEISVQNPRSSDHSMLRDSVLPAVMASLSGNVKSDYPQRVFEIGRVYSRKGDGVSESWHLCCLVAHSQASYTEAKMYLESVSRVMAGKELNAVEAQHWAFAPGRCASVMVDGVQLGHIGEVKPESLEAFGLKVPVSGFEIDLSQFYELLK